MQQLRARGRRLWPARACPGRRLWPARACPGAQSSLTSPLSRCGDWTSGEHCMHVLTTAPPLPPTGVGIRRACMRGPAGDQRARGPHAQAAVLDGGVLNDGRRCLVIERTTGSRSHQAPPKHRTRHTAATRRPQHRTRLVTRCGRQPSPTLLGRVIGQLTNIQSHARGRLRSSQRLRRQKSDSTHTKIRGYHALECCVENSNTGISTS